VELGTNRVCNAHPFISASEFEDLVDLIETLEQEAEDYLTRKKRAQRELGEQPEGSLTDEQKEKAGADWSEEESEDTEEEPAAAATSANGDVSF
jgi:hypothetical protein